MYFPTYHLIHDIISRKTLSTVCVWKHKSHLLTKNLNRAQALKHTATLGLEDVHQVDLCAVLESIFDNTELEWERFLGLCELPTSCGTLLIEFCTDPLSSFVTTGCDYSVFVLPVAVEVDGTSPETVEWLM